MRSLVILLCLGAILGGCSFAKDPKGKESVSNLSNPIKDSVTAFDKLLVGIRTNDTKLFEEGLKKASFDDLNTLTFSGQSLVELCVQYERLEFFEKLVAAGASTFRPSFYAVDGLRRVRIKDKKFRLAYIDAKSRELNLAYVECMKGTPLEFAEYLKRRWISPLYSVCGQNRNFFDHFFSERMRQNNEDALVILDSYLNAAHLSKSDVLGAAVAAALRAKNESVFAVLESHCLIHECDLNYDRILNFVRDGFIKEVLDGYEVLVKRYRNSVGGLPSYFTRSSNGISTVMESDDEARSAIEELPQESYKYFDKEIDIALINRRSEMTDIDESEYFDKRAKSLGLDLSIPAGKTSTPKPLSRPGPNPYDEVE
nr:hypothetical protein HAGR004_32210 [Bdellovibrio sp. HAGR004]